MDFPLSSSVILVVAVALWIVWVAPYMLRNSRQLRPAGDFLMDAADVERADPQAGNVVAMTSPQEKPMTSTQRPASAPSTPDSASAPASMKSARPSSLPANSAFRIRYGRLALALLAVVSLLTGVVSGVLRLFGLGSGWLPVLTLLAAVAAVVLLRSLAVRDRRRKVERAFRSAMAPPRPARPAPAEQPTAVPSDAPAKESPLFDAEADGARVRPVTLTVAELRQAALAEAAASGDTSVHQVGDPASPEGASWEPVQVPKPTYVEAPKAERAAPEPLDLPAAPKAVGKPSLKQASVRGAEEAAESKPQGKGQSALSNLDDVLQRRRA
ncbi:hypothetical protein QWJ39_01000 [Arthrobacter sp. YD4]|uniref:hypothetical protein n=1 Tax=Arthrobacter sp. YD4 TaxID=3058043 RepID=UPI0025B585E4|nr:hypothetical protein [Arthrobacter sp. YD4]MDN3934888.1 hypothetical protein [Arthrobacter sp. YD4]